MNVHRLLLSPDERIIMFGKRDGVSNRRQPAEFQVAELWVSAFLFRGADRSESVSDAGAVAL